jgi:hypothetical protein
MTALNLARAAKFVALFGFVLPWVLVSCGGEPVGRLTGIDLATGGLTVHDAAGTLPHGSPNLWVVLSLAAVILGIVLSFLLRGRQAMLAMIATAAVALLASIGGVSSIGPSDQTQPSHNRPLDATASGLGEVDLQYGYYITAAGLLGAIAASGAALTRRQPRSPTTRE